MLLNVLIVTPFSREVGIFIVLGFCGNDLIFPLHDWLGNGRRTRVLSPYNSLASFGNSGLFGPIVLSHSLGIHTN